MDATLLAWARAASRRRNRPPNPPPLWLFTDARRLADPRPVVARLPKGLAGVVLRHDEDPRRAALGRDLARLCRARRLALVVAGDPRLAAALGAGMHLRGGRWPTAAPPPRRRGAMLTSSAHDVAELRRAARAGVDLVFLSPAFATGSHPGATALGPLRWGLLARTAAVPVGRLSMAALGGIDGASVRRLPRNMCRAVGAIDALARGTAEQ
jgi:thiamine-phosphate pyrophosphorylase